MFFFFGHQDLNISAENEGGSLGLVHKGEHRIYPILIESGSVLLKNIRSKQHLCSKAGCNTLFGTGSTATVGPQMVSCEEAAVDSIDIFFFQLPLDSSVRSSIDRHFPVPLCLFGHGVEIAVRIAVPPSTSWLPKTPS